MGDHSGARALQPEHDEEREAEGSANARVTLIKGATSVTKGKATIDEGRAREVYGAHEWADTDIVEPTYEPEDLLFLYEISDSLRQNIDAMAHNVDGYGHAFDPVIDLTAEDAKEHVAAALRLEAALKGSDPEGVTEELVEQRLGVWQRESRIERAKLRMFFESCCFESSFLELRRRTTVDKETIGWGAWEVIRDKPGGHPVRFKHVPSYTLRLMKPARAVEVDEVVPTSTGIVRKVKVKRRFRTIMQREDYGRGMNAIYFKEYGDPSCVCAQDGKVYENAEAMAAQRGEEKATEATEILWFAVYHPASPYGEVRWHGVIPQIKGSREAHESTLDYLENSAIPRCMLLLSDARLGASAVKKLEDFFKLMRGEAENRIAIVEAETPRDKALEGSGRATMEYVSLRESQRDDATFSNYIGANVEALGSCFRIPPLLRGVTRDFNRATAVAALEYAEEQVFVPEREAFDWIINRRILPALGARFWRFRSRGPRKSDPEIVAKVTESFLKHGVVMPAEARAIAERTLGIELLADAQDFQRIPLQAWLAGFQPPPLRPLDRDDPTQQTAPDAAQATPDTGGLVPNEEPADSGDVEKLARELLELKARLEKARLARQAARTAAAVRGEE